MSDSVDFDLVAKILREHGHTVGNIIPVPENAGEYEFEVDGKLLDLEQARELLEREDRERRKRRRTSLNRASMVGPLDFTFAGTGTSAYTAAPGDVATYSFALAPTQGNYAGPVSFTVAGLPAGAVASFLPNSVAADGGAVPVTMMVQMAPATGSSTGEAMGAGHSGTRKWSSKDSLVGRGVVLGMLLLPFGMNHELRDKFRGQKLLMLLLMAGLAGMVAASGPKNDFTLRSPESYTLTVAAASGKSQHSQTVKLVVQSDHATTGPIGKSGGEA